MKVLIVAELLSRNIPALIRMNTVQAVLFLASVGYISMIFAAGASALMGDDGNGFDKNCGSEVTFPIQTSAHISL